MKNTIKLTVLFVFLLNFSIAYANNGYVHLTKDRYLDLYQAGKYEEIYNDINSLEIPLRHKVIYLQGNFANYAQSVNQNIADGYNQYLNHIEKMLQTMRKNIDKNNLDDVSKLFRRYSYNSLLYLKLGDIDNVQKSIATVDYMAQDLLPLFANDDKELFRHTSLIASSYNNIILHLSNLPLEMTPSEYIAINDEALKKSEAYINKLVPSLAYYRNNHKVFNPYNDHIDNTVDIICAYYELAKFSEKHNISNKNIGTYYKDRISKHYNNFMKYHEKGDKYATDNSIWFNDKIEILPAIVWAKGMDYAQDNIISTLSGSRIVDDRSIYYKDYAYLTITEDLREFKGDEYAKQFMIDYNIN